MEAISLSLDLIDLIILVGICQGFFLMAYILRTPPFSSGAGRYLAYAVGMIAIISLDSWLVTFDWDEAYYLIDYVGDDIPWVLLFCVPLFRFYLLELNHPFAEDKRFHLLSLPFWIFTLLNIVVNLDIDWGLYRMPGGNATILAIYTAELLCALVLCFILTGISGYLLFHPHAKSTSRIPLKRIWIATGLLLIAWVVMLLLPEFEGEWGHRIDQIFWAGICFGFFGTVYRSLFPKPHLAKNPTEPVSPSPSSTSETQYLEELKQLMEQEQLYTNPDLGRDHIAQQLGISPGYLSQILGRSDAGTFTQFVNGYRVEAVKKMLVEKRYAHYSLLAIGQEAGFKSKSAFYTTFKKLSGMTPKAYREAHK